MPLLPIQATVLRARVAAVKSSLAIAGAVLGAVTILYAVMSAETDEEKLQGVLNRLEAAVQVAPGGSTGPMRLARLNQEFEEIFDASLTYKIPELLSRGSTRGTLAKLATHAANAYASMDIDLSDSEIVLMPTGTFLSATVSTRAGVTVTRHGRRPQRTVRRVTWSFDESDGDWKITRFRVYPLETNRAKEEEPEGDTEPEFE